MSHPFNREKRDRQLGQLDHQLGEKWVSNPFDLVGGEFNLSAFEANRVFLNEGAGSFYDITGVSGIGYDFDSRAVAVLDYNNDGRLDLAVRSVGGKPLVLAENHTKPSRFLRIQLRAANGNLRAIGARVTVHLHDRTLTRQFYPKQSFMSQSDMFVHFGLGDAKSVASLEILWPSGKRETFSKVPVDQRIRVTEGQNLEILH